MAEISRPGRFLAAVCLLVLPAWPAGEQRLGGSAGVLDRMGAGIAELGAGNTGTALEGAAPAAFWNPAQLAFQKNILIGASADMRSLSRNGGMVCVQGRAAPRVGLGLGIVNRGDFNIKVYDEDENLQGTARPQDIGIYLGVGVKTSRRMGFGVTVQWYQSAMDIGGSGDVNIIGILNAGWYRAWTPDFRTAAVVRNLGMNSSLSADYDMKVGQSEDGFGLEHTGSDYLPKTFIAAAGYGFTVLERRMEAYLELLDFQLNRTIIDSDLDHHAWGMRAGAHWKFSDNFTIRTGTDRGNISAGWGYVWKTKKGKSLQLNYAFLFERGGVTFNPFGIGLRYEM